MCYSARLSQDDAILFVQCFSQSTVRKMTELKTAPVKGQNEIVVTLKPNTGFERLLENVLKGVKCRQWSEKFHRA